MQQVPFRFFRVVPPNLRDVIADVTWFFHWGPRDAGALTWTELAQWHEQARRIARNMHRDG
ncbi:GpE family phage tail protein [Paraburkholderia adhaesiva]|uniref:GpE family phage tail protein n=1 Tax=Paraburkholderia adhaesiva TaxID=2883244 RepID=UPI001F28F2F0|nr:GpE family phage tail protein [Paraburkholderia adhaesiva]